MKTSSESISRTRDKATTRRYRVTPAADSSSDSVDFPREQMIAEAAYFRAEQRGFAPGNEMSDWLCAESDVEHLLRGRQ